MALATLGSVVAAPQSAEAQAQLFKLTTTWQNPPACTGPNIPAGCDTATSTKAELGSGADPIGNYAQVTGSPFAPTATTFNVLNLNAGTRYCIRWTRQNSIPGDPVVVCGTSDTKPGNVSGVTIIFQPCPNNVCQ